MKKLSLLLFVFILASCQHVKQEELAKLNGYWEIKQVTLSNGENKEYKVNETIDFFALRQAQPDNKMEGFRQKVMPQFDGSYKTNGIKESIKIIEKEGDFFIDYKTQYSQWQEQIVAIEDSTLMLKNKNNLTYIYKRFRPFSLK